METATRIYEFSVGERQYTFDGDGLRLFEGSCLPTSDSLPNQPSNLIETRPAFLRNLALNLTNNCNFCCGYCYAKQGNYDIPGLVMTLDTAKHGIDLLCESVRKNDSEKATIALFGGEPLLEFELIKEIVAYTKRNMPTSTSIQYLITTNGTLIDKEVAEFMQENGFIVTVSIDGDEETHDAYRRYKKIGTGTYNDVVAAAKLLQGKVPLTGRLTVAERTPDVCASVLAVKAAGFDRITYAFDYRMSEEAFQASLISVEKLLVAYEDSIKAGDYYDITNVTEPITSIVLKRKKRSHCNAGLSYLSLSADGAIHRCPRFTGIKQFSLGKIQENNLLRVESSIQSYQRSLGRNAGDRVTGCYDCAFVHLCGGLCSHQSFTESGSEFTLVPRDCSYRQFLYKLAIKMVCNLTTTERRNFLLYLNESWRGKEVNKTSGKGN